MANIQETPYRLIKSGHTAQVCKVVAQAMNSEIFLCDVESFFKDYNPCGATAVNQSDIDDCKKYLVQHRMLEQCETVWRDFPSKMDQTNKEAAMSLALVISSIWNYAEVNGKKQNPFTFKLISDNHVNAAFPGSNETIDVCAIEAEHATRLYQDSIMIPIKSKAQSSVENQSQACEQIVGQCYQIMCDDPRRMFIYAITIVDTHMSIWYFSRTHSVKSVSFDWVTNSIDTFIHAMLAFAFAKPQDLGIDPWVHKAPRLTNRGEQHYVYKFEVPEEPDVSLLAGNFASEQTSMATDIDTKATPTHICEKKPGRRVYYRTVKARAMIQPRHISARMSRIWEVIEVPSINDVDPVDGAVPVILKDVWVDAAAPTEGDKQDAIFDAVDKFVAEGLKHYSGPDAMMSFMNNEARFAEFNSATKIRLAGFLTDQRYRNLFLTKILEYKGPTSKKTSKKSILPGTPLFLLGYDEQKKATETTPQSTNVSEATDKPSAPSGDRIIFNRRSEQKRQVRFIYKEVCRDLREIPKLGDAIDLIRQALDALQILYCAGWVHRDVSMGNILAHRVEGPPNGPIWTVKLSDLEFAQPLGFPKHRTDSRTGTPYYMAVEIMNKFYLVDDIRKLPNRFTGRMPTGGLVAGIPIPDTHPHYEHYNQFKSFPSITSIPQDATPALPLQDDTVSHNYQHDLESIWWILLYLVTSRTGHAPAKTFVEGIFVQDVFAAKLRGLFFTASLDPLYHKLLPSIADSFHTILETLREEMYQTYVARAVFGHLLIHKSYSAIHAKFVTQIDEALLNNHGNWRSFDLIKKEQLMDRPKQASKRPLPQDDGAVSSKKTRY